VLAAAPLAPRPPLLTSLASSPLCLAPQYKVKDIAEADFGRLEIELAEAECPGLMACR
jgi:hypothetical protein